MFNQYVLILVWIGLMALLQGGYYREEYNDVTGEYDWRVKMQYAVVVILPIIWMAANRGFFADTIMYTNAYYNMPESFSEIPNYIASVPKDKAFSLLSAFIKVIFGYNRPLYLGIIAAIQMYVIAAFYRRYSIDYVLSIFLFIASSEYISWVFNGIRQFMAVIIIVAATALMIKKKYLPLILVIFIASTFHQSALIMIPFVLVAQGKPWNWRTILFLVVSVGIVFFVDGFTNVLNDTLVGTQYENVVSDYQAWSDDGANFIRVIVYAIPTIIAFVYREQIAYSDLPIINLCVNMSILSTGLYIVAMVTSGIFMGRLPIYCSLYNYILLPWEIQNLPLMSSKKSLITVMVVLYTFYYIYALVSQFGLL